MANVLVKCGQCERELEIPTGVYHCVKRAERGLCADADIRPVLERQYEGFYVSRYGGYYCNSECLR